jgi:hypothetical protein
MRTLPVAIALALTIGFPSSVAAQQQSLSDVLSFLLINRSVSTGDFARDEAAAAATRDTLVSFLAVELNTLPTNSPASGFTYRLDPAFGAHVRSSSSFGPFYMQRSLTVGKGQVSFGLAYNESAFDNIDGRELRDGTLVSTAGRLVGDAQPFDAETLTLRIRTRAVTASGHVALTDRLDVTATVPLLTVSLDGHRVDTYRGESLVQATAVASRTGLGDLRFGAKYNAIRHGASGVAFAGEARLPTGDSDDLLGTGEFMFTPRVIASLDRYRFALHGDIGYVIGGPSDEVDYSGAVSLAASERLTLITELLGRRFASGGRLVEVVDPHPSLAGVETIRLSGTEQATNRVHLAAGVRWNVAAQWLFSMNVLKPLTTAGLNAGWTTTASFDVSMGN